MKTSLPAVLLSLIVIAHTGTAVAGNPSNHLLSTGNRTEKPYNVREFFRASLYTSTGIIIDGNAVAFDDMFNNGIDGNDAHKLMNFGENFGIMRDDQLLSIEARSPAQLGDTIYYNLQNLRQQDYQLRFKAANMETSVLTAYLVDKYLQTSSFLSLSDTSFIDISVTADAGSYAADRFYVLFEKGRMRELNFVSLTATWGLDKAVDLNWKVDNERDVDHYTIERSSNGTDFTSIGTKNPAGNNGSTELYNSKDQAANRSGNYYRIKATDAYGQTKYSNIVNSGVLEDAMVNIYPNPVKDRIMNIQFINLAAGKCKLQLSNKMGQVVYSGEIDITSTNMVKAIRLDHVATTGTYQLSIIPAAGKKTTQQVMIK